jgi:hypothetical protein
MIEANVLCQVYVTKTDLRVPRKTERCPPTKMFNCCQVRRPALRIEIPPYDPPHFDEEEPQSIPDEAVSEIASKMNAVLRELLSHTKKCDECGILTCGLLRVYPEGMPFACSQFCADELYTGCLNCDSQCDRTFCSLDCRYEYGRDDMRRGGGW